MSLLKPKSGQDTDYRQIGILAAIPAILLAAPLIGFFLGNWLDKKFGTEPYLLIAGVLLGLGSAGIEVYNLARKSAAMSEDKDDKRSGT